MTAWLTDAWSLPQQDEAAALAFDVLKTVAFDLSRPPQDPGPTATDLQRRRAREQARDYASALEWVARPWAEHEQQWCLENVVQTICPNLDGAATDRVIDGLVQMLQRDPLGLYERMNRQDVLAMNVNDLAAHFDDLVAAEAAGPATRRQLRLG